MIGNIFGWIFKRLVAVIILVAVVGITFPDAAAKIGVSPQVVSFLYKGNAFVGSIIASLSTPSTTTAANPKVSTVMGTLATGGTDTMKALKPVATFAATITADPGPWLSLVAVVIFILILITKSGRRWANDRVSGVAKNAGKVALDVSSSAYSKPHDAIVVCGLILIAVAFVVSSGGINFPKLNAGVMAILPGALFGFLTLLGRVTSNKLLKALFITLGVLGLIATIIASFYSTPVAIHAAMAKTFPTGADGWTLVKSLFFSLLADISSVVMILGSVTSYTVVAAFGFLAIVSGIGIKSLSGSGRQGNPA